MFEVPGSVGYQRLIENSAEVDVLTNHWDPFFVSIAGKYGLSEQSLRRISIGARLTSLTTNLFPEP